MHLEKTITRPANESSFAENSKWVSTLDFLWLEITPKCNLSCVHCYAESSPKDPLTYGLTYDDWVDVLEQIIVPKLGCRKMQFIGGEPTLHPKLLQLIADAKNLGYEFVEVFTNGTVLNAAMFEAFCKFNVNLALSVYSSQFSVHDTITQHKGSYAKTIQNIKQAVKLKIPVRVGIIEMDENSGDSESATNFLRRIEVESVGTDRLRGIGRGETIQINASPMNELCGACWQGQLAIDSKGDVFPCVFSRFCKVGVISEGLSAIMEKPILHSFREEVREIDEARKIEAVCSPKCNPCSPYCRPYCSPTKDCHPRCFPF